MAYFNNWTSVSSHSRERSLSDSLPFLISVLIFTSQTEVQLHAGCVSDRGRLLLASVVTSRDWMAAYCGHWKWQLCKTAAKWGLTHAGVPGSPAEKRKGGRRTEEPVFPIAPERLSERHAAFQLLGLISHYSVYYSPSRSHVPSRLAISLWSHGPSP